MKEVVFIFLILGHDKLLNKVAFLAYGNNKNIVMVVNHSKLKEFHEGF